MNLQCVRVVWTRIYNCILIFFTQFNLARSCKPSMARELFLKVRRNPENKTHFNQHAVGRSSDGGGGGAGAR
jgi:hypothetical protein